MESIVVALIVAAAAVYAGRRLWRTVATARRKSKGGCGGDCCGE
jgi:type II secretory pathway pseudopilin PulG